MGDKPHAALPHRAAAHAALGILGNIASCLFFLSSVPTIVRIVRCKSSGGLSGDLYVFTLFNCMLWCLYGLPFVHPHDVWVVLTNSFGCAFSLIYILAYLCYTTVKEKISLCWKLCAIVSSFITMVVLLVLFVKYEKQRILVVGIICTIVSSVMHIILLSQCRMAMQMREKNFLHPNASIAAFLKGAIWIAYGVVNFDIFILIPNGVGVMIGIIQAILVLFLVKRAPLELNPEEDNNKYMTKQKNLSEIKIEYKEIEKQEETPSRCNVPMESSLSRLSIQGSVSSCVVVPVMLTTSDIVQHHIAI